jgi:hypothetical protein
MVITRRGQIGLHPVSAVDVFGPVIRITAIVATHDPVLIGLADRVLNLRDGLLVP